MKKFDVFGYIKKFRIWIIVLSLLALAGGYMFLNRIQTYTSSAIIRYANVDAVSGLAPDGSNINTAEIYSSKVISDVFYKMGMRYSENNIDDIRSKISVEALRTEEKTAIDEATIAQGEEIVEKPVEYKISFTVNNGFTSNSRDFVRQFMDELLDNYISFYAQAHVSSGVPAINDISRIAHENYDYLEMAELLKASVSNANDELKRRADGADEQFRSTATGYNFLDIQQEFLLLKNINVWELYSFILENHITQNRDLLLNKYQTKIDDYIISNENTAERIEYLENIIKTYVNMMRESGNTNITYEYILNDVESYWYMRETGEIVNTDQEVRYDTMLKNYAGLKDDFNENEIEIAYCKYILDVYSGSEAGNTAQARAEAMVMIQELSEKADRLFHIMQITNDEYNEYIGAQNIQILAGIAVKEGIPIKIYALLIASVFGLVGCVGAIVLGRLIDIFEYYVYTEHKFGIPNRAACDRLLSKYGNTPVSGEFVSMSIRIENLKDKNRTYGVETVDHMIMQLLNIMEDILATERNYFMCVNNPGQLFVFAEAMTGERAAAYCKEIIKASESYNKTAPCRIEFTIGAAEARENGIYQVKDLMLCALRRSDFALKDESSASEVPSEELSKPPKRSKMGSKHRR